MSGVGAEIPLMYDFSTASKEGGDPTHITEGVVIPDVLHPIDVGQVGFCEWGESAL
ncbi:MAG: hypothetical protein MK243_10210 [Gemmatimonadetes bacterium]|nr:hypothetical protein [Gemmatimonadota bacterium]